MSSIGSGCEYVAAAVNFRSSFCQPQESLERMVGFVGDALSNEPDTRLIVFPECATTGLPEAAGAGTSPSARSSTRDSELRLRFLEIAERVPGYTSESLGAVARQHGVYIATGFVEVDPELSGVIYNSSLLLGPDGDVVGIHRKVHAEWIFKDGDYIRVYPTAIGRIGLSICYDLWFPEVLRLQALAGCQVHLNMTANQPVFAIGSTHFPIVRAAENGVYVVSANRVGDDREDGGLAYMGASSVIGPRGDVLGMGQRDTEQVVYGRIALCDVSNERRIPSPLQDRRTDLYDVAHVRSFRNSQEGVDTSSRIR